MADFPDVVEASLRARFVSLGVRPDEVTEQFIRGAGAGVLLTPGHDGTDGFFVARWRRPC